MPIIQVYSGVAAEPEDAPIYFDVGAALEALPTLTKTGTATFPVGVSMAANPFGQVAASANVQLELALAATPRINNEPTVLLSADFELGAALASSPAIKLLGFAPFQLGATFEAVPSISALQDSELLINLTILPQTAGIFNQATARLLVDGVVVPIKSFQVSAPTSAAGSSVNVTLADPSQRSLVLSALELAFQIGVMADGSWSWQDVITAGRLTATQLSIGWSGGAPSDELSIGTVSNLADKLNIAPENNLTLYDPNKVTPPDLTQVEPVFDTAGNEYTDVWSSVGNLSLYKVFQKILIDECGFAGYRSNLPDYPIMQASFDMGSGYFSGIAPLIGMFEPLTFEVGGVIWIVDATITLPVGFPAPRLLSISRYRQLSLSQEFSQFDGFVVNYSESADSDFFSVRVSTNSTETGSVFDNNYTRTVTTLTYREHKRSSNPNVVVRSELISEKVQTFGRMNRLISEETLTRTFDALGREISSVKNISMLVPELNGSDTVLLTPVLTEKHKITYGAHPYKPKQQIQMRSERNITGLIAIDTENQYLDEDFEQAYIEAHKAGNLSREMSTRYGAIKNIIETTKPLANGQVETFTKSEDLLRQVVTLSHSDVKAGDVGLNNQTSVSRRVIVLSADDAVRSGKPLGSMSVAELPLEYAVPLARRKLSRATSTVGGEISVDFAGVDQSIRRGTVLTLEQRGSNLGAMIVEGFRITGENLGTSEQRIATSLQGVKIS